MRPDESIALGLGAMRLSSDAVDEPSALRLLHEALDRGVRFFDTADAYAPSALEIGHNERLLAKAIGDRRGDVVVATKGGLRREAKQWFPDGRANHLKTACEASLRALGVERIDLYQLHAPDPKVPLATSVRALASLQKQGKIRDVGLCNVRLDQIETARELVAIASVQVELSPLTQTALKNGVVDYCVRHGIRVIAHSPLGGHRRARRVGKDGVLGAIAKRRGVSPYQVALAWLRRIDAVILPIPGVTRFESLVSSLHALEVSLSDEDIAELDAAFPAGSVVRKPRRAPASADGEIVLFVGYPGAGKSTLAEEWLARGYQRMSRDVEGGTLAELTAGLERRLAAGERRIVMDNTYPRRESRFDVIELARKYDLPVRCVWLDTTLEQAQVNSVRRMLSRYGRLLEPDEIKASQEANDFGPEAQFRYRRELENPRPEEGFSEIEVVPFTPRQPDGRVGKAILLDTFDASPKSVQLLERYAGDGYRLFQVTYRPGSHQGASRLDVAGLEIDVLTCSHHPGAASCWCRKPLPGFGVLLIERHALDPSQCIVVGKSVADRGFAERLGFRLVSHGEFFGLMEVSG